MLFHPSGQHMSLLCAGDKAVHLAQVAEPSGSLVLCLAFSVKRVEVIHIRCTQQAACRAMFEFVRVYCPTSEQGLAVSPLVLMAGRDVYLTKNQWRDPLYDDRRALYNILILPGLAASFLWDCYMLGWPESRTHPLWQSRWHLLLSTPWQRLYRVPVYTEQATLVLAQGISLRIYMQEIQAKYPPLVSGWNPQLVEVARHPKYCSLTLWLPRPALFCCSCVAFWHWREHLTCKTLWTAPSLKTDITMIVSVYSSKEVSGGFITFQNPEGIRSVVVLCRLLLAFDTVLYNRMTLMYMVCVFCREPESISICSGQGLGLQEVHSPGFSNGRSQWPAARRQTHYILWGNRKWPAYSSLSNKHLNESLRNLLLLCSYT